MSPSLPDNEKQPSVAAESLAARLGVEAENFVYDIRYYDETHGPKGRVVVLAVLEPLTPDGLLE